MITKEDIEKIKQSNIETMKKNFRDSKNLFPIGIVMEPTGKLTYIGMPYRTHEEKYQMMEEVKSICRKSNAIAVFIINEAWIKKIKQEDYPKIMEDMKKTGKTISDYGDKEEIAIMLFETKTSSQLITFEIDRTKNELVNMNIAPSQGGEFKHILCDIVTNSN